MIDLVTNPQGEGSSLPPEMIELLRAKARSSLYFFAKGVLGYADLVPSIHKPICELLEDFERNTRLKITLPRGWFKTTICSIAYPIWRAINNKNVTILIAQNTHLNAVKKLGAIDDHFRKNQLFRLLFPELIPDKTCTWKTDSMAVPRTKACAEGTFDAAGIGTKVVSRHYDVIIEDDTVAPDTDELGEENMAPTKQDIGQAIGWHRLVTPLLVHPSKSQNIVVGTRWFDEDLLSWIEEKEKNFKSYTRACRENEQGEADPQGELTFPERFDEQVLAETEARLGPYMFSCLYLNLPVKSSDMTFKESWFKFFQTEPAHLITWTSVDLAGDPSQTKGKDPDYNVVLTTGKNLKSGEVYVLHYDRFRGTPSEVIEKIFTHNRLYHPILVRVESVGYQNTLAHWIKIRQRQENCYFTIDCITHGKRSKSTRILGLQPFFSAGRIFLRGWMRELQHEMLVFPLGKHDDVIDALSMHTEFWKTTRAEEEDAKPKYDSHSVEGVMEELRAARTARSSDVFAGVLQQRDLDLFGAYDDVLQASSTNRHSSR